MKTRHLLATPTPWLATGMGLVVGLVCLLTGWLDGFADGLRAGYESQGFPELSELGAASVTSLIALIIFTFGSVLAVEGTPGTGRRVMLLVSGLLVVAMASPVLALWGIFWNPLILLIAMIWAGIAAMIHAANREQHSANQNEQSRGPNVISMQSADQSRRGNRRRKSR